MTFREHEMRAAVDREIHARPPVEIATPAEVSHLACLTGEQHRESDREHLVRLCSHFKVTPPTESATHFSADFGPFRLTWERHTEFSTYMFIREGSGAKPFKEPAIDAAPDDWIAGLPGEVIAATHLAVEAAHDNGRTEDDLASLFDNNPMSGGQILDGRARMWSDFRLHADRFERVLICNINLDPRSLGRIVQRVLEMETYRPMAMLAFPLARDARPKVAALESELADVTRALAEPKGVDAEQDTLKRLSALAGQAEAIMAETNYRFSAARAYAALVRERWARLREQRVSGLQPATEFLARRMNPAMETCDNLAHRQEQLSSRISRASNLLRTRIDVALEAQNRDLLKSMDRRAKLQLRLQKTVEGLSVVAISYYLLSIVSYLAKGAKEAGVSPLDPYTVVLAAFIPVVALVWGGVHRVRRKLAEAEGRGE